MVVDVQQEGSGPPCLAPGASVGVVLGSSNPTTFSVACSDDVATFVRTRSKVTICADHFLQRWMKTAVGSSARVPTPEFGEGEELAPDTEEERVLREQVHLLAKKLKELEQKGSLQGAAPVATPRRSNPEIKVTTDLTFPVWDPKKNNDQWKGIT